MISWGFVMAFETGDILEGKITGLTKFGAFVSLPDNISGMIHISEVSYDYVKEVSDYLCENQTVKVKVLDTGGNGRVSLSIKQANPKPVNNTNRRDNHKKQQPDNKDKDFENMMTKFKKESEEKISCLKINSNNKRG